MPLTHTDTLGISHVFNWKEPLDCPVKETHYNTFKVRSNLSAKKSKFSFALVLPLKIWFLKLRQKSNRPKWPLQDTIEQWTLTPTISKPINLKTWKIFKVFTLCRSVWIKKTNKKLLPFHRIYSIVLSKGVDDIVIITHQPFTIAILRQSMHHMALLRLTYISAPQMASFNVEEAWCKVTGFLLATTSEMQRGNFTNLPSKSSTCCQVISVKIFCIWVHTFHTCTSLHPITSIVLTSGSIALIC